MSAQMTSQEFNRIRIAFMQRLSAPNIPHAAFKLGWLIAFKYMNCKTGVAYPPQTTLAADLNLSVRHVRRLLDILERRGLKIIPGDSRGRASTYWIDPEKGSSVNPFPTQKADTHVRLSGPEGGHPCPLKADTHVRPTNRDTTKKEVSTTRARTPLPENLHPELAGQEEFERFCDHARANAGRAPTGKRRGETGSVPPIGSNEETAMATDKDDDTDRYWMHSTGSEKNSTPKVHLLKTTSPDRAARPRSDWIRKSAQQILSSYRKDDFADPHSYGVQLAMVLERYDDAVIRAVTSPLTGIQRKCKFPPSIAEIVEACDAELRSHTYAAKWEAHSLKQLRERDEWEAESDESERRRHVAERILAEYKAAVPETKPQENYWKPLTAEQLLATYRKEPDL